MSEWQVACGGGAVGLAGCVALPTKEVGAEGLTSMTCALGVIYMSLAPLSMMAVSDMVMGPGVGNGIGGT